MKTRTCLALILLSATFGISPLAAADRTWNGGGTNNYWTTSTNWNSLAVAAGDSLFFAGTTRLSPSNDFPAGTVFSDLTFNAGGGTFALLGNPIVLGGNLTNHQVTSTVRIGFDLIPTSTAWIVNVESNEFGSGSLTITGAVSGAAGLIKNGLGLLTLGGANTFTGAVTVAEGTLRVDHDAALGTTNGATTVNSGATLNVAAPNTGANGLDLGNEPIFVAGPGVNGQGAIVSTYGNSQINALQLVTLTGDTTFGGTGPWTTSGSNPGRWDIRGTPATAFLSTGGQPYNLTKGGSNEVRLAGVTVDPALANIDLQQGALGIEGTTTSLGNPASTLTVHPGATLSLFSPTNQMNKIFVLIGDGVTDTVDNRTGNNTMIGSVTLSNECIFRVQGSGGSLTNRGPISGSGGLTKKGGGTGSSTLVLTGPNPYTGNTRVSVGTLMLSGTGSISHSPTITVASGAVLNASARTDRTLVVNSGQTLKGNGSVLGRVTIAPGGTLSPGDNSLGFITVTSNADFAGVVEMEINRTNSPNSDRVTGISTVTYGGMLTLANLGPALQAGDCFTLFAATNYTDSFAATNLPPLGAGLAWNTSTLAQNGSICVVALPPVITCPANISTNTFGNSAAVNYLSPTVVNGTLAGCTPASGSVFAAGTTLVTCTATNACCTNTCAFNVTVQRISTNCLQFAGFEHCPLGAATLNISSNQLVVANLGTNGTDGVSVDLGQVKAWEVFLETLDTTTLPTGAYLEAKTEGMFNGTNGHLIVLTRIEDIGSQLQATFDFSSIGASHYTVQVLSNGFVLDSQTGLTGVGARFSPECVIVDPIKTKPPCTPAITLRSPTPTTISITGHAAVVGDEIRAFPDEGTGGGEIQFFSGFKLQTAGIPSFRILSETTIPVLFFEGLAHSPEGQAHLTLETNLPSGSQLTVTNIGTNGLDGVEVALGQAHSWEAVLTNLNASILPTGAYLVADNYGRLQGAVTEQRICSTRIEDVGSLWQLSFDFTPIGASTYTVEVRLNGVVVDSKTGVSGPAAIVPDGGPIIDPVTWLKCPPDCYGVAASVRSPTPANITIPGHATVGGDQVLAYPVPTPMQTDFFTRVFVTASRIPSFTIKRETVVAAAPVVTAQPQSQSVIQGGTATFTAEVNGNSPMFFQWRLNGADIPGATNASFTIAFAQTTDAGFYTVLVTSAFGSTSSTTRSLTVTLTQSCCDGKNWYHWPTYDNDTPKARSGQAMAYHNAAGHQYVVMFGGEDSNGARLYDTWEWSGYNWFANTPREYDINHPLHSPPARRDHAMAFLPANGSQTDLTFLFGGADSFGKKGDIWSWDGIEWKNKTPGENYNFPNPGNSPNPSARRDHAMAFDGNNNALVMFGGNDGVVKNDTWLWDGKFWKQVFPATQPPARQNHAMTYDSIRNVVVLFGGDNVGLFNDTWEWDGTDWKEVEPTQSFLRPSPRRNHALAFAGECGSVVMFGGEGPGLDGEYWERQDTEWVLVTRALSPSARGQHAGAFHEAAHQFLVFGGLTPSAASDTWSWGFERANNGAFRTDVFQEGISRELWGRELTTRRFSWHKVGKFLNAGPGHHYFTYEAYTASDQANTTQVGNYPPFGTYEQKKAKNKCNDDFTDCLNCTSGCIAENSDCRWHSEQTTLFKDYALSGNFCNPVSVFMSFFNGERWFGLADDKLVGKVIADGVTSVHSDQFVSPAIPSSTAQITACRQERHDSESGYTPHELHETIKGKEARVDTQWTVSHVGCGISSGLNALDPQCTGGGAGNPTCPSQIQYFEFGQVESALRFEVSVRASSFGLPASSRTFCFYVDADNDPATGSPNLPECGADYRVCVTQTNNAFVAVSATVECYNPCLDPPWQATPFAPFDLKFNQNVMEVSVLLSAVGRPLGTYSAWVASFDGNTLCDTRPGDVCFTRMQLACINPDLICPRVVLADPYDITGQHLLTAPIRVTFTEAMQPFAIGDVQIVPPVPFTVSREPNTQRILFINPVGAWQPGYYTVTLLPTLKDLAGNPLDGNRDGVCGDPFSFSFCVPDPDLFATDPVGVPKEKFASTDDIYVKGAGFPASANVRLYLVTDGNIAIGNKLADCSQGGPHTVTTFLTGEFWQVNLGKPTFPGSFKVVADVNLNGYLDLGDRVTDLCGAGLRFGEPCYSTVDSIVGWWPFEDADISTAGELMAANHGTMIGTSSSSGPGVVGKARTFGGATYLSVPDDSAGSDPQLNFGVGDFSIEAWIQTVAGDNPEMPLVDKRSAGANFVGYYLRVVNGKLGFLMGTSAGSFSYGGVGTYLGDGQWHHVGVSVRRTGSGVKTVKLYVNGVVQATDFSVPGNLDNVAELRIGGNRAGDSPLYFLGAMDELELYDRALEPEEMLFIYNQGPRGKCTESLSPVVVSQPTNSVVVVGSWINLSVSLSTIYQVQYQWRFNGIDLTDAGGISGTSSNVLTINQATLQNAGYYTLVARNFTGEETSQPILVRVVQPVTLNYLHTTTNITLLWSNLDYRLQASGSLSSTGASLIWTDVAGTSPVNQPLTGPRRFFRLIAR